MTQEQAGTSAALTMARPSRSAVTMIGPKTSTFAMSSIISPSVAKPVRTLNPLQTKENRLPPFEIMESSTQQTEVAMGWGTLPAVGTEYGPCEQPCQHRDCASNRVMLDSKCRLCGESIGPDKPFFRDDDAPAPEGGWPYALAHAVCVYKEDEATS